MSLSNSVRGQLVVGLLTITACATAPVSSPPPPPPPRVLDAPPVVAAPAPAPVVVDEGAFGFKKGMTVAQANAVSALRILPRNSNTFAMRKFPVDDPRFSEATVVVSPKVGLCRVRVSSAPADPPKTKSLLDSVMGELTGRHGAPDPDVGNDPTARAVWAEPFGVGSSVWVYEAKDSKGTSTVVVDYLFTNYETCASE